MAQEVHNEVEEHMDCIPFPLWVQGNGIWTFQDLGLKAFHDLIQ